MRIVWIVAGCKPHCQWSTNPNDHWFYWLIQITVDKPIWNVHQTKLHLSLAHIGSKQCQLPSCTCAKVAVRPPWNWTALDVAAAAALTARTAWLRAGARHEMLRSLEEGLKVFWSVPALIKVIMVDPKNDMYVIYVISSSCIYRYLTKPSRKFSVGKWIDSDRIW